MSGRGSSIGLVVSLLLLGAPAAEAFTGGPGALEVRRPMAPTRQKIGDGSERLGAKLDEASVDAAARAIVDRDPAFFQVDSRDLRLLSVRTFSDGRTYAQYRETWRGMEVVDSFVDLEFAHGQLVLANAITWPASSFATLDPRPAIAAGDADDLATRAIAARARIEKVERTSEAVVVPTDHGMRLAFRNLIRSREPIGKWETLVAADGTGEILGRADRIAWDVAQVTIEAEPRHIGDTPVALPAKGITISGAHSDLDGIFSTTSAAGPQTITVSGAFFDVTNLSTTRKSTTLNVQGGAALEGLDWAFADATPEEVDAYTYANTAREHELQIAPDLAYFRSQFPVKVDESGVCNAFYDGASLNFFPLGTSNGTTCNNTGRIADVTYHEYGHSIHDHLTNQQGFDSQIQEGVADIFAHTITEDPNLGPYFFPNNPVGIRNAEDVRTYPTGVQGADSEVHESGKIWTNTFWNIRKAFIAKYGEAIGRRKFDLLHSDTLRSNPGYTSVYLAALAANDDDGDLTNGTPDSCEMNPIFDSHGLVMSGDQPVRGFLALSHTPPTGDQAAGSAIPVSVSIQSLSPSCGGLDSSSVTLHYTVNGGAEQTATMSGSATTFSGSIPSQKDGSVVEYWFTAKETAHGVSFGAPLGAPGTSAGLGAAPNVYRVHVGALTNVYFEDFESGAPGWTHGADVDAHDDWEIGTPTGAAIALDPTAAFSGTHAAGNDLGIRGGNGLYEAGVDNWLDSPTIDCTKCQGARLQFRRWLSVEGSPNDKATVSVNGTVVWTNEAQTRSDLGWDFEDLDISALADGKSAVRIRFELQTDGGFEMGGWTLDDIALRAASGGVQGTPPPAGGSGLTTLHGGCMCSTTESSPAGFPLGALLASLVAGAAIARRRRA